LPSAGFRTPYDLVAEGWCQGAPAACETGAAVAANSPLARRWSASGALAPAAHDAAVEPDVALYALRRSNLALTAAVGESPGSWNDAAGRRQDEVLEALVRAVSLVQHAPALAATHR
jgi:hypothetical protein